MKKKIILIAVIMRVIGICITNDVEGTAGRIANGEWQEQINTMLQVNPDELLIAEVALNYRLGMGYVSSNEIKRSGYIFNSTAFRPTYPIWFHIQLQSLYQRIFPDKKIIISSTNLYFKLYALVLHLVSFILFIFSVRCFFSISENMIPDRKVSLICVFVYILYPSVIYYIGNLPNYESIALSCVIIGFYFIHATLHRKLTAPEVIFSSFLISFSTLIRPQLNIIFFFILLSFAIVVFRSPINRSYFFRCVITISLFMIFLNSFVLVKNHKIVGRYTLSTQSGFSFFEGHNPYARGSWCGDCGINPKQLQYQFIRNEIPGFDTLTEIQQSDALAVLGKNWIYRHPFQEAVLTCRKAAMFFLPYNSDSNVFNIINLLIHLGFILFTLKFFYRFLKGQKGFDIEIIIIGSVLGSVILSDIFFVGFRWRYYAEPFMILAFFIFFQQVLDSINMYKNQKGSIDAGN